MCYDNKLIAEKLDRWKKYLGDFRLPNWEEIPDLGLYMEQVVTLLRQYLTHTPPELQDEQLVTAAIINNYVRMKIMPMPLKKKYYRTHIAYLIMICTLKQSLSISVIQRLIPSSMSDEELKALYSSYVERHGRAAQAFIGQVYSASEKFFSPETLATLPQDAASDLIMTTVIAGGFCKLLAEKLLLLDGKSNVEEDGKE